LYYRKDFDRYYKKIWPNSLILDVEETRGIQSKYKGIHDLENVFQIVTDLDRLGGIDKLVVVDKRMYGISERIRNPEYSHFKQLTLRPVELQRALLGFCNEEVIRPSYFAYGAIHANNKDWAYLYIIDMDKFIKWAIGKPELEKADNWAHPPEHVKANDPFFAWDFRAMPKHVFLGRYGYQPPANHQWNRV
jgi:hypothetical protein